MVRLIKLLLSAGIMGAAIAAVAAAGKKKKSENTETDTEDGADSEEELIVCLVLEAISINKNPSLPGLEINIYGENGKFDFDDYIKVFDAVSIPKIKEAFETFFGEDACELSDLDYDAENYKKYLRYMREREERG